MYAISRGARWRSPVVVALVALTVALTAPPAGAVNGDVTADIKANRDVVLTGDAVVRLTGGVTTYTGVISGEGTFTVAGTGTLVLTKDSDFTLPAARRRQKTVTVGGNHPVTGVENPDPPAVVVAKGVTLQYGAGKGPAGSIGHYTNVPGFALNTLNHQVDGALDVALEREINLGIMSGTGFIKQRRGTWPGITMPGSHPFSGLLYIGTGAHFGTNHFLTAFPNAEKIVNQGSLIHGAPNASVVVDQADIYSQFYGNDINFHTWGTGVVRMNGVYSWSDSGSDTAPALSDPSLNFRVVPHKDNKRGINIEGATVEWGDGSDNTFFVPGNENTVYINMHADRAGARSKLTLNYNGPVTLGAPISGGIYHDTMNDVGRGDVVIAGTPGNAVTFTAPQNYDGSTTIGKGASLRLGDGTPEGDSSLLVSDKYEVVDDGELIVQNTAKALSLAGISGTGAFTQAGAATTTLTGRIGYQGKTTVKAGTLAVTGGSLAASGAVELTAPGTRLDLTGGGEQTVNNLAGVAGSTVAAGGGLTLTSTTPTTFDGTVTASDTTTVVKGGPETLTLNGANTTPGGKWIVREGKLKLGTTTATASVQASEVAVEAAGMLDATGTVDGAVVSSGVVTATRLTVRGAFTQQPGATLTADGLEVGGPITLGGKLALAPGQAGTVIDNSGDDPVTGEFDGLPEGTTIDGNTITYRGGDGNDVVVGQAETQAARIDEAVQTSMPTAGSPALIWSVLGAVALALAVVVLLLVLRRRRRSAEDAGYATAPISHPVDGR